MKLIDQVTSIELSKRLKELGVKQESVFVWDNEELACAIATAVGDQAPHPVAYNESDGDYYSAFTVAELGEMLPCYIQHPEYGMINIYYGNNEHPYWWVAYRNRDEEFDSVSSTVSEAEARGLMLEYLITNNLMTV